MDACVEICRGKHLQQVGDSHNKIQTSGMMVQLVVTMELMLMAMISIITQWRSTELLVIILGHGKYLCTISPLQFSAAGKLELYCLLHACWTPGALARSSR